MVGVAGMTAASAKRGNALLTDAQVLEARALLEFGGASNAEIGERYGLTPEYVSRLKSYRVRSKLIPKPSHLPPT